MLTKFKEQLIKQEIWQISLTKDWLTSLGTQNLFKITLEIQWSNKFSTMKRELNKKDKLIWLNLILTGMKDILE